MIDIIKEILNQLIALGKYRQIKRREFFEEHIEPLFQMMLKIQKNYREIFLELRSKLSNENMS